MSLHNELPLVSIGIPNYNYGRYLENCFDSILSQTYPRIEVIFRDNASTDDSLQIARMYEDKFKKRQIPYTILDSKRNIGSENNSNRISSELTGDYCYWLASDDAIEPTMIQECVELFEEYPDVGLVMTSRVEVDENENEYSVAPFYNAKCIIPGDEQAAVFMLAGIAIPGERMVKRGANVRVGKIRRPYQVAGDWFSNYLYSCCNDIGYINKPLCRYRVHIGNETNISEIDMLGVFEHYKLINHFREIAKVFNQQKALDRYEQAVTKLGDMCIRYATRYLKHGYTDISRKYLALAPVFDLSIENNIRYQELLNISQKGENEIKNYFKGNIYDTTRTVSYSPPEGSIILG